MSTTEVLRLIERSDEVRKTASTRPDPQMARLRAEDLLLDARELLDEIADEDERMELAAQISRRMADLDLELILQGANGADEDVARAPTSVDDPARVPPGQHLTAGWPVLHTGGVPEVDLGSFRFTVTGLVERRLSLTWEELRAFPEVTVKADMHCVTAWSRLDNTWTGVRPRDLLERAGLRPESTHVLAFGRPAYSANLPLEVLLEGDVLLAWAHDGKPLTPAHGGPLRLVVPSLYAWKSVKWVHELRTLDHDVPGYWEARGYHNDADPWREQRFHGD